MTRPWSSHYYYSSSSSSSSGLREYAYNAGAEFAAVSTQQINDILAHRKASGKVQQRSKSALRPRCLFSFPAKDNWVGHYFPLSWINDVRTYVLAYVYACVYICICICVCVQLRITMRSHTHTYVCLYICVFTVGVACGVLSVRLSPLTG
eukprot:GHVU01167026.1.p1 GENE.GHVU01167026.1~~GHVU01167026.1.p1  ORF type:complete len:150 (+),score=10.37 GHVU01167026.1:227-676(+)